MASKIDALAVDWGANISPDGVYRYRLSRVFTRDYMHPRTVFFVMLNPSTADAKLNDPTIRRCMKYATDWGYEKLVVLNLFAYRATDPRELYKAEDPIGPDNDGWIKDAIRRDSDHHVSFGRAYRLPPTVVCAWGEHGAFMDRDQAVLKLLRSMDVEPMCLALTSSNRPKHPLRLAGNLKPIPLS